MRKAFFIFLIAIFFIHLGFRVYSYRNEYTSKYNSSYWKKRYQASQWVFNPKCNDVNNPHVNPVTCKWDDAWFESHGKNNANKNYARVSIGDDAIYAYAGWEYLHGLNPILLNAEIPPLGKYLIGISIFLFQNQNIIILLTGFGVLLSFYFLNLEVFKNKLIAFIPVVIFSFDPLFYTQLRASYIDLFYLLALLLTLFFAQKRKFIFMSIVLGFFASLKYPLLSFLLLLPILIWVFTQKDFKKIRKKFLISLLLTPIIFLSTYIVFFIHKPSLIEFLKVQKWIYNFYATGAKSQIGIVYPLILTGNWYTWFGGVQKVAEWTFLWPLSFVGSVAYFVTIIIKKEKNPLLLQSLWIVSYLAFLTLTPVFPRYLLLILPFLYNLSVWVLLKVIGSRRQS